jgi:hypothetical protein
VANRVHATVNLMQPPVPDPPLDPALGHAGGVQLRRRHDAVLTLGELRNRRIATRDKKPFYAKDFLSHNEIVPPQAPRTPPR